MRIEEAVGGIYLRSLYHLFRLQHSNFTHSFVGVVARCFSYLRSLPKIGYALEPGLSKSFLNVKVPSLSFGTCSTFPFLTSRSSSYCHVFRVVFFFTGDETTLRAIIVCSRCRELNGETRCYSYTGVETASKNAPGIGSRSFKLSSGWSSPVSLFLFRLRRRYDTDED